MEKEGLSDGCKAILRRLLSQRRIGGKNLPERICLRWIKHLNKDEHKEALKDWKRLISEGIVLTKPKPYDRMVFLNPRKLKEIQEFVR